MAGNLLIANPDSFTTDRMRQYFVKRGYRVDCANDGLQCWEKLRRMSPSILILDANLPWGGGDGVLACMRSYPVFSRIPVILVTDPLSRMHNVSDPVVRCLQRPFEMKRLFDEVALLLSTRSGV
ncbi:MAG: response regulator [Planctomycetes bacterium]|nr:response regulator [Planctomycetota bacterium]